MSIFKRASEIKPDMSYRYLFYLDVNKSDIWASYAARRYNYDRPMKPITGGVIELVYHFNGRHYADMHDGFELDILPSLKRAGVIAKDKEREDFTLIIYSLLDSTDFVQVVITPKEQNERRAL